VTRYRKPAALGRRGVVLGALAGPIIAGRAAQEQDAAQDEQGAGTAATAPKTPSSDTIRDLLSAEVDPGRESLGYVAAVVDAGAWRLITAGQSGADDGRALGGDSVFEIGSITKVFTALLLADMVQRGEVALDDPVAKYLPPEGRPHAFDGKPMSLLDLATYTSGLPRMPDNFQPANKANPYADYTVAQLYQFISGFAPLYFPGSHYEYANLGFGLLGHALALRAGRSYEELVVARICTPLELDDTRITLTPDMQRRLVPGHDTGLRKVSNWDLPTLAGAGALRSTANDLCRFLDACQGRRQTSLAPGFASLLDVRRQTDQPNLYAAEGWFVETQHGDEIVWKDGGTGGYATFIGYSARTNAAAVLLANSASWHSTPRLGLNLLNPAFPVPPLHHQIALDPAKLPGYAGRYPITPQFVLTVTPKDGRLMVQATHQDEYEVFPESNTQFFYRVVNAQLTFELGPDGSAIALVLHQNGRDRRAIRLP
jgi:D-alanyl-D-alanine-carboxypeptidase/D-alanyl-D-alanine-endopeptidase